MGPSLKAEVQTSFDYELEGKSLRAEDVHLFGDQILLFASWYDGEKDRNELFVQRHDASSLRLVRPWTMISYEDAPTKSRQADFGIAISPNHKMLLVHTRPPWEKGGPERLRFEVFDDAQELAWSSEYALKYANEDFTIDQYVVDDDGTVMILGTKDDKSAREVRKDIKEGRSYYEYHLLVFGEHMATPKDYALRLGDKFLQAMNLAIPWNSEDIICTGFYSDRGTGSAKGFYFMKLDRVSKEVVHTSYSEFEEEFITMFLSEKAERKAKRKAKRSEEDLELADFEIREVLLYDDGGIRLIAEQYDYWQTTSMYRDFNGMLVTTTIDNYLYRDLMVMKLSSDGDIIWKARIPKRQRTSNDAGYHSGYASAAVGDDLYFVFNDNRNNLNFKKGETLADMSFGRKSGMVALVRMNGNGDFSREPLFRKGLRNMRLVPQKATQLDNSMVIVAEDGGKRKFGRLDFK